MNINDVSAVQELLEQILINGVASMQDYMNEGTKAITDSIYAEYIKSAEVKAGNSTPLYYLISGFVVGTLYGIDSGMTLSERINELAAKETNNE